MTREEMDIIRNHLAYVQDRLCKVIKDYPEDENVQESVSFALGIIGILIGVDAGNVEK